jgi:hypothetical protein
VFAGKPLGFPCGLTRAARGRVLSRAIAEYRWGAVIDRRNFCRLSAAAVALGLTSSGELAPAGDVVTIPASLPIYKVVFDDRFAAARAFGASAQRNGLRTAVISGDVTALWLNDLKAHWQSGGAAIAGMTTARTLLCLEQLAHDTWRRVLTRTAYPAVPAGSDPPLVSWIISL